MKRLILIFNVLLLSPVLLLAQGRVSQRLGNYISHEIKDEGLFIFTDFGNVKITAVNEDIIHVVISKEEFVSKTTYAVVQDSSIPFSGITQDDNQLLVKTNSLKIKIDKKPLNIAFLNLEGQVLNEGDDLGVRWIGNQVTAYKKLKKDEKFIGLGEKTGPLNRRGQAYENWNNDDYAYEIDDDPIYSSVPFYMGIHDKLTYGIFLNNSYKTVFNFGASNDRFSSFSAEDGELDYYFFGNSTIRGIVEDYTWLTGRMNLPPIWSLGFQQSRWSYYPDSEVINIARTFREKKIPADVIYLDIHYMDAYKLFTWSKNDFPNPKETVKTLNEMGFHVAVIVDPGIKKEKGYSVYEDGLKKDVFVKYPDGTNYTAKIWPGWCHFPDFTSNKSRKWWGDQFQGLVDIGVEGFWNDMNEPASWGNKTPDLIEFEMDGNSSSQLEAHNIYGMQMSRSTLEGVNALRNNSRSFILTRAAFAGTQRYSAIWTGDNVASDEHMLLSARMVSSMGLSGFSFAGPDVGGFVGKRTPELFTRWLSQGVFTPFFRNHAANNTKDHEPWAYGEQYEKMSRNYINLRYELMPYIYSSFYESTRSGIPVARSLAIDYTFDDKIYTRNYQNQYLFGPNLLVAPTESKQKYTKVYLPEGKWYHLWSDKLYVGNQEVIVGSPLDQLPIFAKEGAIIPRQSVRQYTLEQGTDTLYVHVYNGSKPTNFDLYEDDGVSKNYENEDYSLRKITFNPDEQQLMLSAQEGQFDSKWKHIKFVLHGFNELSDASVNGNEIIYGNNYMVVANKNARLKVQLKF